MTNVPSFTIIVFDTDSTRRRMMIAMLSDAMPHGLIREASTADALEHVAATDIIVFGLSVIPVEVGDRLARAPGGTARCASIKVITPHAISDLAGLPDLGLQGMVNGASAAAELGLALRTVAEGGGYLSRSLLPLLLAALRGDRPDAAFLALTSREQEVLMFVARGMSNKAIARWLNLSVRTVETHRLNIRKKTGAGARGDLVRIADQLGLLDAYRFPADVARTAALTGFHEEE